MIDYLLVSMSDKDLFKETLDKQDNGMDLVTEIMCCLIGWNRGDSGKIKQGGKTLQLFSLSPRQSQSKRKNIVLTSCYFKQNQIRPNKNRKYVLMSTNFRENWKLRLMRVLTTSKPHWLQTTSWAALLTAPENLRLT